jgi:uncharacterized protein YdeI (YjbR/CyaY-like superfamily)
MLEGPAMTESQMNPKVDAFIGKAKTWGEEFATLRAVVLGCQLTEELKWGVPCYTSNDKNIVLMHGFKEYCALLFMQGALMKDKSGILIQQTENVQAARQIRFTSVGQIAQLDNVLKAYIEEAVELEKSGAKVSFKKTSEFNIPEEFQTRLDGDRALKAAFEALTPGRQKAYLLYFSSAKQSKTRESRIDKSTPDILAGKGLDD